MALGLGTIRGYSAGGTYSGYYCPGWGTKSYIDANYYCDEVATNSLVHVWADIYFYSNPGYTVNGGWTVYINLAGQQRSVSFPNGTTIGGTYYHLGTVHWYNIAAGPGVGHSVSLSCGIWFTFYLSTGNYNITSFKKSPGNYNASGTAWMSNVIVSKPYIYRYSGGWHTVVPQQFNGSGWVDTSVYSHNGSNWIEIKNNES